jgi:hypothetical protein
MKKTTKRRILAVPRAFRMLLALIFMWVGYPIFLFGVFIGWGWKGVKQSWRNMP